MFLDELNTTNNLYNETVKYLNDTYTQISNICEDLNIDKSFMRVQNYLFLNEINENYDYYIQCISRNDIVLEGRVWDTIKEFFKKVVEMIMKIWHWIINFFKMIIGKVKELFNKIRKKKAKSPQKISLSQIHITNNNAEIKTYSVNSIEEIQPQIDQINKDISKILQQKNNEQNILINKMKHEIDKKSHILNDSSNILQEKEIYGKGKITHNQDENNGELTDVIGHFLMTDAQVNNDHKSIESFQKNKLQLILESKDIVQEYKNFVTSDFKKMALSLMSTEDINNYTPEELDNIMKISSENINNLPDDPEKVKGIIRLRLSYNKRITGLLSKIIKINYQVLGYSAMEANMLANGIASGDTEAIRKFKLDLLNNSDKYYDKARGTYDLTPIGGGYVFRTTENLGELEAQGIDTLVQDSLRWDCIILAHGNTGTENEMEAEVEINRLAEKAALINQEYIDNRTKIENSSGNNEYLLKRQKKLENEYNKITKEIRKIESNFKPKGDVKWVMQPVYSKHSGPFVVMEDLVKQLVHEGFKRILIMSCNPGSHKLPTSLTKIPGVLIKYGNNTILR